MINKLFYLIASTGLAFYGFITTNPARSPNAENNPPNVKIIAPLNNSSFQWNTMVNYTISVTDKEDGSSEYNEIANVEVMLKVMYLPDSSIVTKYLSGKANNEDIESAGIALIKTSACFTCHAAKNKLIGPSFELIAKKYPNNPGSVELLAKQLIKGSSGVWGNIPMPPHPDLKTSEAQAMIRWILKYNRDPDLAYFMGIQGGFHTKQKPGNDTGKGVYILTASYTDHGLKDLPKSNKRGVHTILLKNY